MIQALKQGLDAALEGGDLHAANVATQALQQLLSDVVGSDGEPAGDVPNGVAPNVVPFRRKAKPGS